MSEEEEKSRERNQICKQTGLFTFWTVVNRLTDESGYVSG